MTKGIIKMNLKKEQKGTRREQVGARRKLGKVTKILVGLCACFLLSNVLVGCQPLGQHPIKLEGVKGTMKQNEVDLRVSFGHIKGSYGMRDVAKQGIKSPQDRSDWGGDGREESGAVWRCVLFCGV